MTNFRRSLATCFLGFMAIAAVAQDAPPAATLTANPVFQKNCSKCHGKTAEGRHFAGPSLLSEKSLGTPADELRNIIANGKGHMPKFATKLTSEEIDTLVQEIKAQTRK